MWQSHMGPVRPACDTTLSRDVAIKALPGEFAHGEGRLVLWGRRAVVGSRLRRCRTHTPLDYGRGRMRSRDRGQVNRDVVCGVRTPPYAATPDALERKQETISVTQNIFSNEDIAQIEAQGTTVSRVADQIEQFKKGVPFIRLHRACTVDDGITRATQAEIASLSATFETAQRAGRASKFVPSSGAASRMFKTLHSALEALEASKPVSDREYSCFTEYLDKFPFFNELSQRLTGNGQTPATPQSGGDFLPVLRELLHSDRMNYGGLPKGLLLFHQYPEGVRTPVEEHLAEAVAHTESDAGRVRIHFTVSPEHEPLFQSLINRVRPSFEQGSRNIEVGFSSQKTATDTIAVSPDDEPFRTDDGCLLFRPAGHGALIDNLADLEGDLIFIKNIDNVVPDRLKSETVIYKKIIGGLLIRTQGQVFEYLEWLDSHQPTRGKCGEILEFVSTHLGIRPPGSVKELPLAALHEVLIKILNRPIRVCGMVKNEDEPGGGPFWVTAPDGAQNIQIVELSQIDDSDPQQAEIVRGATHFNPVDLVCGVRDYRGLPFELHRHVDRHACFISEKSAQGRPLKALELPRPLERRHVRLEHRVRRSPSDHLQPREDDQRPPSPPTPVTGEDGPRADWNLAFGIDGSAKRESFAT